jgi:hypothetical protein
VIFGLFLATLVYLQYQQLLNINWAKVQSVSQNTFAILGNATSRIDSLGGTDCTMETPALSYIGIPLTGGMSMGFVVGLTKG